MTPPPTLHYGTKPARPRRPLVIFSITTAVVIVIASFLPVWRVEHFGSREGWMEKASLYSAISQLPAAYHHLSATDFARTCGGLGINLLIAALVGACAGRLRAFPVSSPDE